MPVTSKAELYRKLPSVDELLRSPELASTIEHNRPAAVTDAARTVLGSLREEIAAARLDVAGVDLALSGIIDAIKRQVRKTTSFSLRSVINATGVVLHTNLGRAPLSETALEHVRHIAVGYSNLEFDVETGNRGTRDVHVNALFRKLLSVGLAGNTGAPEVSTIVVNNNAAAVLLALNTLAEGGEVIVSRGELVEIGGSFRIPDVMTKSLATLREVGTTNRTRLTDYERAINDKTRLFLRVHRSNFRITGFTEQPAISELVALAKARNIPLVEDLGSGSLFDLRSVGIEGEPSVLDSINAGVDVVSYSGDKLLGGPQAGMLSGRGDLIDRMRAKCLAAYPATMARWRGTGGRSGLKSRSLRVSAALIDTQCEVRHAVCALAPRPVRLIFGLQIPGAAHEHPETAETRHRFRRSLPLVLHRQTPHRERAGAGA